MLLQLQYWADVKRNDCISVIAIETCWIGVLVGVDLKTPVRLEGYGAAAAIEEWERTFTVVCK